jgi:antitoxin (DNA-binding transcriptional repressor) of toxin-antitoxin stability system
MPLPATEVDNSRERGDAVLVEGVSEGRPVADIVPGVQPFAQGRRLRATTRRQAALR